MKLKNVLFLDIDGVIQPYTQKRFKHNLDELKERLTKELNPVFSNICKYDTGAAYYDWHPTAIANLRYLCEHFDLQIVVSSAWRRSRSLEELKALFSIYGLQDYIVDKTVILSKGGRESEIQMYLDEHPEIERYIVVDDMYLSEHFPNNKVWTNSYLNQSLMHLATTILEGITVKPIPVFARNNEYYTYSGYSLNEGTIQLLVECLTPFIEKIYQNTPQHLNNRYVFLALIAMIRRNYQANKIEDNEVLGILVDLVPDTWYFSDYEHLFVIRYFANSSDKAIAQQHERAEVALENYEQNEATFLNRRAKYKEDIKGINEQRKSKHEEDLKQGITRSSYDPRIVPILKKWSIVVAEDKILFKEL